MLPLEAFIGPTAVHPLLWWFIGVAGAVVCVVILVRLYRPKHLEERTGAGLGTAAGGSTDGAWGYGPGGCDSGSDSGGGGGGQC